MKSLPNPLMPSGGMGNYQIQYTRDRHALPLTRGYMGAVEMEGRLLAPDPETELVGIENSSGNKIAGNRLS